MNAISSISSMCSAGIPIFARTYASVMNFPGDYFGGLIALQGAGWHRHEYDHASFVSPDKNRIAWYKSSAWHMARRHRTACFDPMVDQDLAHGVLGTPCDSFVIPTTIVVPLRGVSSPIGDGCHCLRIYPNEHEPPHERLILGERVEFRVCISEHRGRTQTYVEANLGGARFTGDKPRREVFIGDHKLLPGVPADDLMAKVLLYLPKFTLQADHVFDPSGTRSDIPRVGSYEVLPRHGSTYAALRLPASSTLLAFNATGRHRVAQGAITPATIIDEEDEVACANSLSAPKRPRAKALPVVATLADALRAMKLAKKFIY